jgi:NTP pyrophosphatase (non-canonical NTP hydrolase)
MSNNTTVDAQGIAQFVIKHDLTVDQQFRQLAEELGELAEALNCEEDTEAIAEEIGDVVFVARTIGYLHQIPVTPALNEVTEENLGKNTETDGDKVTKE